MGGGSDCGPLPRCPAQTRSPTCNGLGWWRARFILCSGFPKEEDASLTQSKRQKQTKTATVRMRRQGKEGDQDKEEEEDEAEAPRTPLPSPRRRKQHLPSRTCPPRRPGEHRSTSESSLSVLTPNTQSSHWSLALFCQYLCSCCHGRQNSVEENKAADPLGRRDPDKKGPVTGPVTEQGGSGGTLN